MKKLILLATIILPSFSFAYEGILCTQVLYTFSCHSAVQSNTTVRQYEYNENQKFLQKLISHLKSRQNTVSPKEYARDMDGYKKMNEDMFRKYFNDVSVKPSDDATEYQKEIYSEAVVQYAKTKALLDLDTVITPEVDTDDVEEKYNTIAKAYNDYRDDKIDFMTLMYTLKDNTK